VERKETCILAAAEPWQEGAEIHRTGLGYLNRLLGENFVALLLKKRGAFLAISDNRFPSGCRMELWTAEGD